MPVYSVMPTYVHSVVFYVILCTLIEYMDIAKQIQASAILVNIKLSLPNLSSVLWVPILTQQVLDYTDTL